ncbi:MAG: hypothetical protein IJE60_06520 [Tyzzerella sp.]|nr:hypothetical protein [Tyzzerella sp.]
MKLEDYNGGAREDKKVKIFVRCRQFYQKGNSGMQNEFSKKDKYILIFAFIFILIPAFQTFAMSVPILICGLGVVFLAVQMFIKKEGQIFKPPFVWMDWIMFALAVVGLIDGMLAIIGIRSDAMVGFAVLTIPVMFFVTRSEWEITKESLSVIFFGGAVLIALAVVYFIMGTDILFGIGMTDVGLIEAASILTGLIGAYLFSMARMKRMTVLYGIGTFGAMICLTLCGNDIALLILVAGICLLIVNADREVEVIKRLLMCQFLALFIPCNVVLLVQYTTFIHAEVSTWSLQASVVGELVLCLLAVFVCKYWDEIEEKPEEAIKNTQIFFKSVFRYVIGFGVFLIFLGWVELQAGVENILRFFHDSEWKADGIFSTTMIEIASRAGESIIRAYEENALRLAFNTYGMVGVLALVLLLMFVGYKWWQLRKFTLKKDVMIWMFSAIVILCCILLPMRTVMLPIYTFFVWKMVHDSEGKRGFMEID